VVKAHAQRTTVRQFLRYGEKVIIVITINPGGRAGFTLQAPGAMEPQQAALANRRRRLVHGH
jgi:hypothetical protein